MESRLSSRDMILDISSMRTIARQLLGKGKKYEELLQFLVEKDYYNDSDLPLPAIKDLQVKLGITYTQVRNYITQIYDDLLNHQENNVDFSIKKVEYIFSMWYFDNYLSIVINDLPVIPRIGENVWMPYFKAKVGTDCFHVHSIYHTFNDTAQTITISLSPGSYNQFWQIRKGEAYLKREISYGDFITSKDDHIRKKLGYRDL